MARDRTIADWDTYPIVTAEQIQPDWIELDPTGWGAMIAWHLGPESVRRCHAPERDSGFEDEVDSYLDDADLPAHPHGYRWFAAPLHGMTARQLFRLIGDAVRDNWPSTNHPRDISAVVQSALQRIG